MTWSELWLTQILRSYELFCEKYHACARIKRRIHRESCPGGRLPPIGHSTRGRAFTWRDRPRDQSSRNEMRKLMQGEGMETSDFRLPLQDGRWLPHGFSHLQCAPQSARSVSPFPRYLESRHVGAHVALQLPRDGTRKQAAHRPSTLSDQHVSAT